jgi:hypothetical protein
VIEGPDDKSKSGADYGMSLALSNPYALLPKFSYPSLSSVVSEFGGPSTEPTLLDTPGPFGLHWSRVIERMLKQVNLTANLDNRSDFVDQTATVQLGNRFAVAMAVLFAPFLGISPGFPVVPSLLSLMTLFGFFSELNQSNHLNMYQTTHKNTEHIKIY